QGFIDRWAELRRTIFSDTAVENHIRSLTDLLAAEAASRHFAKWPQLGHNTGVSAPGYATRTTYESEVVYLIDFLAARSLWIDSQFITTPTASLPAGPVSPRDSLVISAL